MDGQRGAPSPTDGKGLPLVKAPKEKNHFGEKNLQDWVDAAIDELK